MRRRVRKRRGWAVGMEVNMCFFRITFDVVVSSLAGMVFAGDERWE